MKFKGAFFILVVVFIIFLFLLVIKFSGFAVQDTFSEVTIDEGIIVLYDEFDGSTTNFASLNDTELETIGDMILENILYGKIVFNEIINLTQDVENNFVDLDGNANINFNKLEINTTKLTSLEKSATLYIYNLTFSDPRVLRDGGVCPSSICTENSYSGGIFSFNVTNFTIYSAEETPVDASPEPGGGGSSCTYDWVCTDWYPTPCPKNEIQEKLCVNKGTCTGTLGMPNQTRDCFYEEPTGPLFDIFIKIPLVKKWILSGENIEFEVELINVGDVEELDVFFKYLIVDENNTLIAEKEDTRAIMERDKFSLEIILPKDLELGTYRVFVEIAYGDNKRAVAKDTFEVVKNKGRLYLLAGLIFLVIFLLIFLISYRIFRSFRPKFLGAYKF